MSLLASRYASAAMSEIFAPEAKIIAERKLWIAVMRAQSTLGHAIAKDVITAYESVALNYKKFFSPNGDGIKPKNEPIVSVGKS